MQKPKRSQKVKKTTRQKKTTKVTPKTPLPRSVPEVFSGTKAKWGSLFEFLSQKMASVGSFKTRLNGTIIEFWRDSCFAAVRVKPQGLELAFYYNGVKSDFKKANWKIPRITHMVTIKRAPDVSASVMDALQQSYIRAANVNA